MPSRPRSSAIAPGRTVPAHRPCPGHAGRSPLDGVPAPCDDGQSTGDAGERRRATRHGPNDAGAHMASHDEFARMTAAQMAAAVRDRKVSPVELVDACIDGIEQRNPSLTAFVYTAFDEARARARDAEAAVADDADVGVLHGVPTAIKDLFDFKPGWPATFGGIPALRDFSIDARCAYAERVEDAGAIIVGKTNSPVMGFRGTCDNLVTSLAFGSQRPRVRPATRSTPRRTPAGRRVAARPRSPTAWSRSPRARMAAARSASPRRGAASTASRRRLGGSRSWPGPTRSAAPIRSCSRARSLGQSPTRRWA